MIVLVDDDKDTGPVRRFRPAPPVATSKELRRPRNSLPADLYLSSRDGSDDEIDPRSHRRTVSGFAKHPTVEALRRPGSAMSDQRAQRAASPTTDPSINSFALV